MTELKNFNYLESKDYIRMMVRMLLSYYTVKNKAESELSIKKSRFISNVAPVESTDQAEDFILSIKEKYREATHNVYAYLIGHQGLIQKASDDGEPSGTAGRPILEVIKNKNLQNVVIVVTRYFGGKLLGTGGLIRAYGQSAVQGIEAANEVEKILHTRLSVSVEYTQYGVLQRRIEELELPLENVDYTELVTINVLAKTAETENIKGMFINLTNGQASVTEKEKKYLDFVRNPC